MRVPLKKVITKKYLPKEVDAVIIGAGIVGVCAAYYLNARGFSVALIEKGLIGAEQSSRNWGWCRQQNRDARELPMAVRSLELWDQLSHETGSGLGFRRCGLLYLSNDEKEIANWAAWRDFAKTQDVETFMLSSAEASERGLVTKKEWKGGVFSPTDGIADPSLAAPTLAEAIINNGGHVVQQCAVRGIEKTGGRLSAIVTEHGVIKTSMAVLSAGAWASSFCKQLGITFPQSSVHSSILSVTSANDIPDALHTSQVSITARSNGTHALAISGEAKLDPSCQTVRFCKDFLPMFLKRGSSLKLGGLEGIRSGHESRRIWALDRPTPMERNRILDPKPDQSHIDKTFNRAKKLLPALQNSQVEATWAGYIDSTPDGVPAIGETSVPGFVLAAGFSGHGFGIGPGAGYMIADMLSGQTSIIDPSPYEPSRFAQGSWGKVADF